MQISSRYQSSQLAFPLPPRTCVNFGTCSPIIARGLRSSLRHAWIHCNVDDRFLQVTAALDNLVCLVKHRGGGVSLSAATWRHVASEAYFTGPFLPFYLM